MYGFLLISVLADVIPASPTIETLYVFGGGHGCRLRASALF